MMKAIGFQTLYLNHHPGLDGFFMHGFVDNVHMFAVVHKLSRHFDRKVDLLCNSISLVSKKMLLLDLQNESLELI